MGDEGGVSHSGRGKKSQTLWEGSATMGDEGGVSHSRRGRKGQPL